MKSLQMCWLACTMFALLAPVEAVWALEPDPCAEFGIFSTPIDGLRSGDRKKAWSGYECLLRYREPELNAIAGKLIDTLNHPNEEARLFAASVVAKRFESREKLQRALRTLVELSGSRTAFVAQRASAGVLHTALRQKPDFPDRGRLISDASRRLADFFYSSQSYERQFAIESFRNTGTEGAEFAVALLVPLLGDPDSSVRRKVEWTLGTLAFDPEPVIAGLAASNPRLRKGVIAVLSDITPVDYTPRRGLRTLSPLRELTPGEQEQQRRIMLKLGELLSDRDSDVQQAAARALQKSGRYALPAVPALLAALETRMKVPAACALSRVGPEGLAAALPVLVDSLQYESGNGYLSPRYTLVEFGDEALPAIFTALSKSESQPAAIQVLMDMIYNETVSAEGQERIKTELLRLLTTGPAVERDKIESVLQRLGVSDAVNRLGGLDSASRGQFSAQK